MSDESPQRTSITSGGYKITESEPGEGFGMAESTWDRLYRHVKRIKKPPRWPENLMWSGITLAVGSGISFVLWLFGGDDRLDWQGWIFGSSAVGFVVVAVISGLFVRGSTDELIRTREDILEDMRELHPPISLRDSGIVWKDSTAEDRGSNASGQ